MKYIFFIILTFISFNIRAQVGIGTNSPNQESVLEIDANDKGILMSTVELSTTSSSSPLSSHVEGMMVYNTATSGTDPDNVYPGIYYNDGNRWYRLEGLGVKIGEVKNSLETADHNGWYLLNGRLLTSLPARAQTSAVSLGFVSNLPNAADRILKGNSGADTFMASGGSDSFVVIRENLPNITYSGTTSVTGSHQHSYTDRAGTVWHGSTGTAITGLNNVGGANRTTEAAGDHSHTVSISTGGSNTPVTLKPKNLVVQTFIYLGN